MLSAIVTIAAPCTTWISRSGEKSASSTPNARRRRDHADEQHHVHQGDDARPRLGRREVGREREPGGLRRLQAGADHQEGERGAGVADHAGPMRVARHQDQRERHDREAAELQQRAHPE